MKSDTELKSKENTLENTSSKREKKTLKNLHEYSVKTREEIEQRLRDLEDEWDIERILQMNAAVVGLAGLILGTRNKKWLAMSGLAAGMMAHRAITRTGTSSVVLKAFGFRTRQEIDKEKYALKALRGDFDNTFDTEDAWAAVQNNS